MKHKDPSSDMNGKKTKADGKGDGADKEEEGYDDSDEKDEKNKKDDKKYDKTDDKATTPGTTASAANPSRDYSSTLWMAQPYGASWKAPKIVPPAMGYSIRLTHRNGADTYFHYFEVVKAGDPRSSKSNVGEPLVMPQKGDLPQDKGSIIKPATPPNLLLAEPKAAPKRVASNNPPLAVAAPPPVAAADVESRQADILGTVLTLFGAVYLL
ncbi:hypothetical protein BGZ79_004296 [Entomortierella chlamydospora]|nr:hypothetical protein BGZ79_004296 [Entomortierella chlamydospora]